MKKILYILSIALLGATACSVNELGQPEPVNNNGKVTFVMGLEFPEVFIATRGAMADNPMIDDVHVAVLYLLAHIVILVVDISRDGSFAVFHVFYAIPDAIFRCLLRRRIHSLLQSRQST